MGILLKDIITPLGLSAIYLLLLFIFIALSVFFISKKASSKTNTSLFFSLWTLFLLFLGVAWISVNNDYLSSKPLIDSTHDEWYLGIVEEPLKEGKNFSHTTIKLEQVLDSTQVIHPNKTLAVKTKAFIRRSSLTNFIKVKDRVLFKAKIQPIPGPDNPFDFDFRKIYQPKGINYQTFIDSSKWVITQSNQHFNPQNWSGKIRKHYLSVLEQNIEDTTILAISQSLILGDRSNLSHNAKHLLKEVGAMHLLAISGLHLGIIYLILTKCLSFLRKNKWQLFIQFLLIITTLWVYALITGFSSSVVRAALMLTIFDLGRCFQKKTSPINTLFAAAFIWLLINPSELYSLGFQLSYLAVLGILSCYHPIYKIFNTKNWFIGKIWQSIALTVSAQLFILPLLLYHFGYFSVISILTNLVAIPLVTVVVLTGILALILSPFEWVSNFLLQTMEKLIGLLLYSFKQIQQLNFLNLEVPDFNIFMLLTAFIILIMSALFFMTKKPYFLHLLLLALIINTSVSIKREIDRNLLLVVRVYKLPGRFLCEVVCGRENILITDRKELPEELTTKLNNYWKNQGIDRSFFVTNTMLEKGKCYKFNGGSLKNHTINFRSENIQILNGVQTNLKPMKKNCTNYIICTKTNANKVLEAINYLDSAKIIFDSSVKRSFLNSTTKEFTISEDRLFFTQEKGAWIKNFKLSQNNREIIW